jgi:hypothetical protein
MWQVNPWRSLSSQILGFELGSLGFTPIYDGLKMSWITSIHDENVNTSREVICDAQSMTKWNFIIDSILWRKLDDLWRKSTVIDHKVFCSGFARVRRRPGRAGALGRAPEPRCHARPRTERGAEDPWRPRMARLPGRALLLVFFFLSFLCAVSVSWRLRVSSCGW